MDYTSFFSLSFIETHFRNIKYGQWLGLGDKLSQVNLDLYEKSIRKRTELNDRLNRWQFGLLVIKFKTHISRSEKICIILLQIVS